MFSFSFLLVSLSSTNIVKFLDARHCARLSKFKVFLLKRLIYILLEPLSIIDLIYTHFCACLPPVQEDKLLEYRNHIWFTCVSAETEA